MMRLVIFFLQLLVENLDALAPDKEDPLHELLDDLGEVPSVEDILGMSHIVDVWLSLTGSQIMAMIGCRE